MILALLFWTTQVFAKVDVSTLYRVYDDGETNIKSPHVDVLWTTYGDRLEVGLGFAEDHVSSSSSDVRSFSSREVIADLRREGSAVASWAMEEGRVGWSFTHSGENDYDSNSIGFAGTREFFEKNTTFFSSFSYGEDKISTSKDKENAQLMTHETYSMALTQILSQVSLVQLLLDYRIESGYLGSPYRQARKYNTDGSGTLVSLPENMPLTRNRTTLTTKYNYFVSPWDMATSSTVRGYLDSWGVTSMTFEERLGKNFGDSFEFAFNVRYYVQTQASFYEDIYSEIGPFYTGNKTLSNMNSMLIGLSPIIKIGDGLKLFAKYEYYRVNYNNHTDVGRLDNVSDNKRLEIKANVISAGISGVF